MIRIRRVENNHPFLLSYEVTDGKHSVRANLARELVAAVDKVDCMDLLVREIAAAAACLVLAEVADGHPR